ncbi:MAG: EF-P beta-lysylation protein EpmB [Pseudomonadota bacterium]
MIPLKDMSWQSQPWQWQLQNAVTSIDELVRLLELNYPLVADPFPVMVPLPFLARMEPGNPADPLLLQVLPSAAERANVPGFSVDPVGEQGISAVRGLLHKYHGRVLVVTTGQCAVNCRYCFRRHFPYQDTTPGRRDWQTIFDHIRADATISEVILSGGDPLILPDDRLAWIADELAGIAHIETLRIHTRLPVMIPSRVSTELLTWMAASRLQLVLVTHINHPREIDESVSQAAARLKAAGVLLLNQSVLLRAINDSAITLAELSRKLFRAGILPYYLHLLDPVSGAAHFDVPRDEALQLVTLMGNMLPGYLVPRLVREVPGASSKVVQSAT